MPSANQDFKSTLEAVTSVKASLTTPVLSDLPVLCTLANTCCLVSPHSHDTSESTLALPILPLMETDRGPSQGLCSEPSSALPSPDARSFIPSSDSYVCSVLEHEATAMSKAEAEPVLVEGDNTQVIRETTIRFQTVINAVKKNKSK